MPEDADACGPGCLVCPRDPAGVAGCEAGVCNLDCNPGRHLCDGVCVADDDATACGPGCRACPTDPNGAAICEAGVCGLECGAGFHLCDGACVADDDATACGPGCALCPGDPAGVAVCEGGVCGVECASGFHLCDGACVPDDDATACGAGCALCPEDPLGTALCVGGGCALRCDATAALCAGACRPCPTDGVQSSSCAADRCLATACAPGRALCEGLCPSCPSDGVLESGCVGARCLALRCAPDRRLCGGACPRCPSDASALELGCSGADCVALRCAEGFRPDPLGCRAPSVELVDDEGEAGQSPRLAFDAAGTPWIVARSRRVSPPRSGLRLAHREAAGWRVEWLGASDDPQREHGLGPDLGFDPQGRLHVASREVWTSTLTGRRGAIRHHWLDGGVWRVETVLDEAGEQSGPVALAIDPGGGVQLAFVAPSDGRLIHAERGGSGLWRRTTVAVFSRVDELDLVLDSGAQPRLAARVWTSPSTWRPYLARRVGAQWTLEIVDAAARAGEGLALILAPGDQDVLAYRDADLDALRLARRAASGWTIETVDDRGEVGRYAALALDGLGRPWLAYEEATRRVLRVAFHDGAEWRIGTADASFGTGAGVAIGFDGGGVAIAAHRRGAGQLRWLR